MKFPIAVELISLLSLTKTVPRWRSMAGVCVMLMLIETGFGLAMPWLAAELAAGVFLGERQSSLKLLVPLLTVLSVQALLHYLSQWRSAALAHRVLAALRLKVYDHLQALPLPVWQQRTRGDMLSVLANDVERLADYLNASVLSLLPSLLAVLGALLLMFRIEPKLALATCALLPLSYGLLKLVGRGLRPLSTQMQAAQAKQMATADENFELLPLIKTHARESHESRKFSALTHDVLCVGLKQSAIQAALSPVVRWLAAVAMVLLLLGLGDSEARTPAQMIAFMLYVAVLTRPLGDLADFYGQTKQALGALERVMAILMLPTEPYESSSTVLPTLVRNNVMNEQSRGDIRFEKVHFSYLGGKPIFSGFDLQISAGECVALTGANGCGKSTLTHLLMRMQPLQAGRILIDGQDIVSLDLSRLRRRLGLVSQHVQLAHASVRENIAWGMPDADCASIRQAAHHAQAHDFISALPQGYDTVIGDQGVRLSGGQRQKLALARALLSNPDILILDEATAMWDETSEAKLVAQCQIAFRGRTVIIITHRPAVLALADRVVQL